MNISLRGRLAVWYALAIPSLVFALAFTAQQIMVFNLRKSVDSTLEERAWLAAAAITANLATLSESYEEVLARLTEQEFLSVPLLMRITTPAGGVIAEFGEIPEPMAPRLNQMLRSPAPGEGKFDTISIKGLEAVRIYTLPVEHPVTGRTFAIVQAGDSLAAVAAARTQLWRYTLAIGAVGSLLTLALGLFILSRGLRPLDRILRRVHEIETNSLRTGLPDEPRPPELQALAESLNKMWGRLDDSFKAKEMFVANVSHEMRTPLTAIEGHIEVLLMDPNLNSEARESLERMAREARRLVHMTNNLLLNAQLDTKPRLVAEEVNLRSLVEEVVEQVWVLAEELELGVWADQDVRTVGDYDLLRQLALNLLQNAIKFTPRGGRVDMTVSHEDRWAVLEVSDTGIGIAGEHLPHVMEAFYKVDSQPNVTGRGAGLGLAIVKQIVDLHGGQIEIRSTVGVGTSIKVRLPLAHAPAAAITP